MTVYLKLTQEPDIPLEADTITPSHFAGKSAVEIGSLPVLQGNQTLELKTFFDVSGESGSSPDETEIVVSGNLKNVEMIAGRIHVKGSVGPWTAAEMEGGNIQIEGDAADYLCSGYRGSPDGMKGGRVYVAGNVGREMGSHMRKGFVAVKGNVDTLAGVRMKGGTIIVVGDMAERVGVEATKGMILCLGKMDSLLPTYKFSGKSEREFTNYYLRYLQSRRPDFLTEDIDMSEKWSKFMGDFAEGDPKVEIYLQASKNEHLL